MPAASRLHRSRVSELNTHFITLFMQIMALVLPTYSADYINDDEDEFEEYRARSYSGGFSPSLRRPSPRREHRERAQSAASRRRRPVQEAEQLAGDEPHDVTSFPGPRQFTSALCSVSSDRNERQLVRPTALRLSPVGRLI